MNRVVEAGNLVTNVYFESTWRVFHKAELYETELQSRALCGRRSCRASGPEDAAGMGRVPGPDRPGRPLRIEDLLLGTRGGSGTRLLHARHAWRRGGNQDAPGQAAGSHSPAVRLYGSAP